MYRICKGICALVLAASSIGCAEKSNRAPADNTIPSTPTNTATPVNPTATASYDDFSIN